MRRPLELPRSHAALLCIDLQEEHRADARYLVADYAEVLANVRALQDAARNASVPVVHCAYVVDTTSIANRPFHPVDASGKSVFSDKGDPLTVTCPEVAPQAGEPVIVKSQASAFSTGFLEPWLRSRGLTWLIICGVWTEACVDGTVKDAIDRGFHVLLVKDACGSGTRAMHQVGILNLANRLYGGAVVSTQACATLIREGASEAWHIEGAVPLRFDADGIEACYQRL